MKSDKVKVKRKPRKYTDVRVECVAKIKRVLFRLDRINRRYFRGSSAVIVNEVTPRLVAMQATVTQLPPEWKPRAKGKSAIISGTVIRIAAEGVTKDWMDTFKHLGGTPRFVGAVVVKEHDARLLLVQLRDGVKTLVPRRHAVLDESPPAPQPMPIPTAVEEIPTIDTVGDHKEEKKQ